MEKKEGDGSWTAAKRTARLTKRTLPRQKSQANHELFPRQDLKKGGFTKGKRKKYIIPEERRGKKGKA